ncbi:galectin-10-like isoform X1 [Myotis lucifugus]|uniref:galectin-10-like isoform X1 n=2 Tax=Myotis lucifugus TaxID=59463 RepID=UPI0006D708F4|nr:galectin-10-like isoform X1 [Myotis lucifugus]
MEYLPVLFKENVSISVGSSVKIKGTPIMPFCMTPELQVDFFTATNEDSDIAFSLRVYFGKELVMNSRQGGKWGPEVKSTDMPFRDGQPLEVDISVLSDKYQVTANGAKSYPFSHQVDSASVRMIQVWRDVSLTSVEIIP